MAKNTDKYEMIDISELHPYENNARTHSDSQLEAICNSIKEFGFINPVIIDENNMILVGHGRIEASKILGLTKAPFRRITNLTDDQKRAYILADNKLSDLGGWDEELLAKELENISLDMSAFGFEDINQEEMQFEEDDFDFEEKEKERPEAISKRGEIYKLGNSILMCGDSTNADDVSQLMDGNKADLVVTDPPYNVAVSNSQGMTIENDNMDSESFKKFLNSAFKNMSDNLKEGGAFYIWYGDIEDVNFRTSCTENGLLIKQCLIWVKNQFTLGRQDYQWRHEPCLYGWKEGAGHYFIYDRTQDTVIDNKVDFDNMDKETAINMLKKIYSMQSTIIREDKPQYNELHPTMKPINLISRLIKNSSERNEIVLDLFGGSGTTLIACEQLGRQCRMMEYDPVYVDAIIQRYEEYTGRKAELIK